MQIPIQKINKMTMKYFPYFIIIILLSIIYFGRKSHKSEIEEIEKRQKAILEQNKQLEKENDKLTYFIDKSLSEREKTIEKHYHTKEVINNKISDYEKNISDIDYADSIGKYISTYRYTPVGVSAD